VLDKAAQSPMLGSLGDNSTNKKRTREEMMMNGKANNVTNDLDLGA